MVWEFPPGPGGIGQHAYSVVHALRRKGHSIIVITSADYAERDECFAFDKSHIDIDIIRVQRFSFITYFRRIYTVCQAILRRHPRQIYLSGKSALWLAPIIRIFFKHSEMIGFLHGSEILLPQPLMRRYTFYSISQIDRLFAVSSFTRKLLLKTAVLPKGSISILPNGLNLDDLPQDQPPPYPDIHKVGAPRLLTVGNVSPRKGQHRVIKALPALKMIWPNVHYHIVGLNTAHTSYLIKLVRELKVEGSVTFHGRLASRLDLFRAYCSADIFIMLSENQPNGDVEGFGIAILEANYFGKPAIGAKFCGIEDAIQSGVNGFLVDGDSPQEICAAVEKCMRLDMRLSSMQWAMNHDWDTLINEVLKS